MADLLQLSLNLLPVAADRVKVLLSTLGLLLLLDGRNDSPRCAARAHDIFVGDREQVAFVDSKFAADLQIAVLATFADHADTLRIDCDHILPLQPPSCS